MKKLSVLYFVASSMGICALLRCGGDDSSVGMLTGASGATSSGAAGRNTGSGATTSGSGGTGSGSGGASSGAAGSSVGQGGANGGAAGSSGGGGASSGAAGSSTGQGGANGGAAGSSGGGRGGGGAAGVGGVGGSTDGGTAGSGGGTSRDAGTGNPPACPVLPPGNSRCDPNGKFVMCNYPGNMRDGRPCDVEICRPNFDWYCQPSTCPAKASDGAFCNMDSLVCLYDDGMGGATVCFCSGTRWSCQ